MAVCEPQLLYDGRRSDSSAALTEGDSRLNQRRRCARHQCSITLAGTGRESPPLAVKDKRHGAKSWMGKVSPIFVVK